MRPIDGLMRSSRRVSPLLIWVIAILVVLAGIVALGNFMLRTGRLTPG